MNTDVSYKQECFREVLNCLKNNKVMVDTRDDGIYIRLAGNEDKGEAFTLHFANAYPFDKPEQPVMAQYPNEIKGQKLSNFEIEIASVINRFSRENMSDTPDFILATYLNNCLNAYEKATQQKKNWFK